MRNKKLLFMVLFVSVFMLIGAEISHASINSVYRFYSPSNKAHFFTVSGSEKDRIIATYPETEWRYEGVAYYALSGNTISNSDIAANASIDYSKLNLSGRILASDLASNSCSSGQLLKYNGSSWACGDDDNTGSTVGNTIESSEITDGTIVSADINNSAAIPYSKLDLGSNITSSNITDGTIVNVDINSSAAIDSDKISFADNDVDFNIGNINLGEVVGTGASIRFNDSGSADYYYIRRGVGDTLEIGSTGDDRVVILELAQLASGMLIGDDINFTNDGSFITFASGVNGSITGGELLPSSSDGVVTINDALRLPPISDVSDTCDASIEGVIYYSSTAHALKLCNGTAWVTISAS